MLASFQSRAFNGETNRESYLFAPNFRSHLAHRSSRAGHANTSSWRHVRRQTGLSGGGLSRPPQSATLHRASREARQRAPGWHWFVDHPGPGYKIQNDADLAQYIDGLRQYPVRIGLQPVYAGWSKSFSKNSLDQLDYVLMDALTLPRPDGGWLAIWQIDTMVDDGEEFMTPYLKFIEQVLTTEPIDVFAWPTFLPVPIARQYPQLWTRQRTERIIDLAQARKIAIEINEVAHVPDENFIVAAKRAGLKFSFGTDARNQNAAHLYYGYQMAQKCRLTEADMFVPKHN
jgi:hypothetical protein